MEMSKLHYLWKASAAGLAGLLTTSAYEVIKQTSLPHITMWQSHLITIAFCSALVFSLSAIFLRRAHIKLTEARALSEAVMESLPGAVAVFDASGSVRRWNTNFLGYSASEILKT